MADVRLSPYRIAGYLTDCSAEPVGGVHLKRQAENDTQATFAKVIHRT